MPWIILTIALIFNALANILIKAGMRDYHDKLFFYLITNKLVICGVLAFAAALGCYSFALTKLPLSVAYPVMTGCGFAIVVTASYFLFGESFGILKMIGIAFIFLGIIFLTR